MLDGYWKHNISVWGYFYGRDDFMIMTEPNWGPLCEFLNVPVPDVPYPHVNPY
jgi:hypothetical protein